MSERRYRSHLASRTALEALMYSDSHDEAAMAFILYDAHDTGVCHAV